MNIQSVSVTPTRSDVITIKVPKVTGEKANDMVWDTVDRMENSVDAVRNAKTNFKPSMGLGKRLSRSVKFGLAFGLPVTGLKNGRKVKAGMDKGSVSPSEASHWANAGIGAGQIAGIALSIATVGSFLTGYGSAGALAIGAAAGFGVSAASGIVLANTTTAEQVTVAQ